MNVWTWQDEAWRLYDAMGRVSSGTYSATNVTATIRSLYEAHQDPETGPDDDEGSAGVREPRRPRPFAPAGAAALALVI